MNKPIYIAGDSHGQWDSLFKKIEDYDIKDCILISVGDLGIGFISHDKQMRQFDQLNNRFKKHNIQYMSIRGNHDHKLYFEGIDRVVLSHMELLDDYTYKTLNDQKFLFVGGAISVDRTRRTEGVSYWKDEVFVLDESKIEQCDVLVTHSAPTWNWNSTKDNIKWWCDQDPTLWDECRKEREDHDKIIELGKPSKHYCGHMHVSSTAFVGGCHSRILAELEIIQHGEYSI